METGLGWLGVGAGFAGFVVLYLLAMFSVAKRDEARDGGGAAWSAAALTAVLTIIFWLISYQKRPPFSPGQGLGIGFLIGGLAGAVAILLAMRMMHLASVSESVRTRYLGVYCIAFFSVFSASLPYLLFHSDPLNPMIGFAIGAVMAAIVGTAAGGAEQSWLQTWAVFAVVIAVAVVLAVHHFDRDTLRMWWPMPILIATTACIAGYVASEVGSLGRLGDRPGASFALTSLISAVLLLGLTAIYSWRLYNDWTLFGCVAVGAAVAAIIAWLAAALARTEDPQGGFEAGPVCVLLIVAFAVGGFLLWSGLGIAAGMIAAWAVALPAVAISGMRPVGDPDRLDVIGRALQGSVAFGLSILLFRLFIEAYRSDIGTTDLRIHYTFIGAIIGVVIIYLSTAWHTRIQASVRGDGPRLLFTALLGLLAAATPIVIYLIWALKAVMGLMFGLSAAAAIQLMGSISVMPHRAREVYTETLPDDAAPAWLARAYSITSQREMLLIIGAQLVAIQFVAPLFDLELARATRAWILGAVVLVAVISVALTALLTRRGREA